VNNRRLTFGVVALVASGLLLPLLPSAIAIGAVYLLPGKIPSYVPNNAITFGAVLGAAVSGGILLRLNGPRLLRSVVWLVVVALMFAFEEGSFLQLPEYMTRSN
jgi:hypothetical protein